MTVGAEEDRVMPCGAGQRLECDGFSVKVVVSSTVLVSV
jgi:hypothetical protein